jgi:hypothetical protein
MGAPDKLTPPSTALDKVGDTTAPCKKWKVRLLDINGKPVVGKRYVITAPVKDDSKLNGAGDTALYDAPLPASHEAIKVRFGLKLLPNIDSLFDNYPTTSNDVTKQQGAAFEIGGEYQQTYVGAAAESAKAGTPFEQSPYYNTCVARTSVAFNASAHEDAPYTLPRDPGGRGHGIPRGGVDSGQLRRLKGSQVWPDGSPYAYAISVPEFERYMDSYYSDAPKLRGERPEDFAGKDGIIERVNKHFDVWKGDQIRYNRPEFYPTPTDPPPFSLRLWQYVIIRPNGRVVANGVCTFVFQMKPR